MVVAVLPFPVLIKLPRVHHHLLLTSLLHLPALTLPPLLSLLGRSPSLSSRAVGALSRHRPFLAASVSFKLHDLACWLRLSVSSRTLSFFFQLEHQDAGASPSSPSAQYRCRPLLPCIISGESPSLFFALYHLLNFREPSRLANVTDNPM